jgi:hypothetical protein
MLLGPVPWIPNSPQISILGVGINNNLPQTTYSYKDLYTLNLGGGFLKTVTQNGALNIFSQDSPHAIRRYFGAGRCGAVFH